MSVTVKNAICLHASADDLKFLNPVRNRVGKLLSEDFKVYLFGDQRSQADARLALKQTENAFVMVFAHGGVDYIRSGEYIHRVTRDVVEPGKFLTPGEAKLFLNKVVFCLSCESNGLANTSIAAGAHAFVGFDDIPFNRFDVNGNPISSREFEHHVQRLLAEAVKTSIERFIMGKATLSEAVEFFRLSICQQTVQFVREFQSIKPRREIAALLLRVKDGIRYHGNSDVMFRQ